MAEQLPAQDGPEEVAPGIWRIPVPLPFALRSANIYLVDDGPGQRILFDSGLGLPADEEALRAGLAQVGITVADISALVLTHAHPDHIGLSGLIYAEAHPPIYMLAGEEQQIVSIWGTGGPALQEQLDAMYRVNGLPEDICIAGRHASSRLRRILRLPPLDAITTLHDEQQITLGTHAYTVYWTPGHSDHHMVLLRDDGLFFAGDHILPGITPNIGLYVGARPNPLDDYFGSLERVMPLSAQLVLPGHRRPFVGLAERANELREHHQERSVRIQEILAAHREGTNAYTVAGSLFGERLSSAEDWRFAVAETLAHLEYLRLAGHASIDERESMRYYTI